MQKEVIERIFNYTLDIKLPPDTVADVPSFQEIIPFIFLKLFKLFGDETTMDGDKLNNAMTFRLDTRKTKGISGYFTLLTIDNHLWFSLQYFSVKQIAEKKLNPKELTLQAGYMYGFDTTGNRKKNYYSFATNKEEIKLKKPVPRVKFQGPDIDGIFTEERQFNLKLFLLNKVFKEQFLPLLPWIIGKQKDFDSKEKSWKILTEM